MIFMTNPSPWTVNTIINLHCGHVIFMTNPHFLQPVTLNNEHHNNFTLWSHNLHDQSVFLTTNHLAWTANTITTLYCGHTIFMTNPYFSQAVTLNSEHHYNSTPWSHDLHDQAIFLTTCHPEQPTANTITTLHCGHMIFMTNLCFSQPVTLNSKHHHCHHKLTLWSHDLHDQPVFLTTSHPEQQTPSQLYTVVTWSSWPTCISNNQTPWTANTITTLHCGHMIFMTNLCFSQPVVLNSEHHHNFTLWSHDLHDQPVFLTTSRPEQRTPSPLYTVVTWSSWPTCVSHNQSPWTANTITTLHCGHMIFMTNPYFFPSPPPQTYTVVTRSS